jgi:hypothetical protein
VRQNISLAEVVLAAVQARMLDVHTAIVCRVERVDPAARKVDVRPVMRRVLPTEDDGLVTEALPLIQSVPIGALRAGAARIEMPIAVGCWVVLVCFEDNIGRWIAQGGVDVSPGDVQRHGLTGAVALPILFPDTQQPTQPLSQTDIVVAIDAGGPTLRVTPDAVVVEGDLVVTGSVSAAGEVTATSATPKKLSTHTHNTPMGPSGIPNPG